MTDTREAFQQFWLNFIELHDEEPTPSQVWQACEAHYKERIAELEKDAERWLFITLVDCFCLDDTDQRDWNDRVDEMIRLNRKKFDQAIAESKE